MPPPFGNGTKKLNNFIKCTKLSVRGKSCFILLSVYSLLLVRATTIIDQFLVVNDLAILYFILYFLVFERYMKGFKLWHLKTYVLNFQDLLLG